MKTVLSGRTLFPSVEKTGAAKITVQKFYLPDGQSTQLRGVVPDIVLPSIDEYLPIGEKDLPHALAWDEISSSHFDGKRLQPAVVEPLRTASIARQKTLEEFTFLKKNIDWFKNRSEMKSVSLNLEERRAQKASDSAFRKAMEKEKELLSKNSYSYKEFNLGIPPTKKAPEKKPADDDDDAELNALQQEGYAKFDIHLRETLRILSDAIELGRKQTAWTDGHPPLTAPAVASKS